MKKVSEIVVICFQAFKEALLSARDLTGRISPEALKAGGAFALAIVVFSILYDSAFPEGGRGRRKETGTWIPSISSVFTSKLDFVQNQPPGLRNSGTLCFLNSCLQCLMACHSYRVAILETAKKEVVYHTAWLKCHNAIVKREKGKWNEEDIKGVLICLCRLESDFRNTWPNPPQHIKFFQRIEEFIQADKQNLPWPAAEGLEDEFAKYIAYCQKDAPSQKFFKEKLKQHENKQKGFAALDEGLRDFERREVVLGGDPANFEQAKHPSDVKLDPIRFLIPNAEPQGEQDVGEFMQGILGVIRRCEYPDTFALPVLHRQMVLHEKRTIENETPLPKDGITKIPEVSPVILFPIPEKEITGQELFNDWSSKKSVVEGNIVKYQDGLYSVESEWNVLNTFPQHLVIFLKRFIYERTKNKSIKDDKVVPFTQELQIQGQRYCVVAIAIHEGTTKSGHYTALKYWNDKWWWCNDAKVSEATDAQMAEGFNKGYFYFLEKVKIDDAVAAQYPDKLDK